MDIKELIGSMDLDDMLKDHFKDATLKWLQDEGMPKAKALLDAYKEQLSIHAKEESGWCKFRDAVFLPTIFSAGMWVFEKMLNKVAEETIKEK